MSTAIVRSGRIAVFPYDPSWPFAFEQVRWSIEQALGEFAFDVHHVGSTSVPGLCAKPKIDVDIALRSEKDLPEAIERLCATGREFHGDPYDDGMWTFTSSRNFTPGHRIYVCTFETAAHIERVLFRDYLRQHPAVAAQYASLKMRLVKKSDGVWRAYTNGKSAFVADIVVRARSQKAIKQPLPMTHS